MNRFKYYAIILIVSTLFFVPFIGDVHLFDWDEINFAEAAREMIVTGDYLRVRINYEPFHEKPPLFIWSQVLSMKIFGVNEFAARFPNAVIGIITLVFLFNAGKRIYDEKFGLLWVIAYLGSFLPHFYFKTGIIDPLFNLLMFSSLYYLYRFEISRLKDSIVSNKYVLYAAILNALAVLTKGPVGFLLVFLSWGVFWLIHLKKLKFPILQILMFSLVAAIPTVAWYMIVLAEAGGNIIVEFIDYQIRLLTTSDAGHAGPFYYHFIILFFGCFPASVFAISAFKTKKEDNFTQSKFHLINIILLSVVLIIFSIVKTKIVHYSSLAYFPIAFLGASFLFNVVYRDYTRKKYHIAIIAFVGVVLSIALAGFPLFLMNIDQFIVGITDQFTKAILLSEVTWGGYEFIIGVLYFVAIVTAVVLMSKKDMLKGAYVLFISTALVIFSLLPMIVPKVEQYTQAANIEFFESLQGEDVYISTLDFKSYAQYFYTQIQPSQSKYYMENKPDKFKEWLLSGEIDKDAYFVCRNKKANKFLEYEGVHELYRKNGFVYLKRDKVE